MSIVQRVHNKKRGRPPLTYSILEICPLSCQKGGLLKLEMAKMGAVENNLPAMKLDNGHNYIFSGTRRFSFT